MKSWHKLLESDTIDEDSREDVPIGESGDGGREEGNGVEPSCYYISLCTR